jgi:ubiquinone/menaquinone biosynthesis C-methylase UbiE
MLQDRPTSLENDSLENYLKETVTLDQVDGIPWVAISPSNLTLALAANAQYFGHPQWGKLYLDTCHRNSAFIDRWQTATGSWDDKVVVDIGCGPGNVFAALGGNPKLLIGVDVSLGGLKMAKKLGYQPLLADAQNLPLRSEIADIVVINATLHHCEDMEAALQEAARLVKPGGVLVSDHDLQKTAWHFKGLGRFLWDARLPLYRWINRGGHTSREEQQYMLATEIHHTSGDGMTREFYHSILEPMGFSTQVYPHNHDLGSAIFQGQIGRSSWKYRVSQRLSGVDPNSSESALSLMCVAHRVVA